MPTIITHFIKVDVASQFEKSQLVSSQYHYVFSYQVVITNTSPNKAVKLLKRKWFIDDYLTYSKVVEGEGVVGEQPVLLPGESYEYASFSILSTSLGQMHGYYTFIDLETRQLFHVKIPKFQMVTPWLLN